MEINKIEEVIKKELKDNNQDQTNCYETAEKAAAFIKKGYFIVTIRVRNPSHSFWGYDLNHCFMIFKKDENFYIIDSWGGVHTPKIREFGESELTTLNQGFFELSQNKLVRVTWVKLFDGYKNGDSGWKKSREELSQEGEWVQIWPSFENCQKVFSEIIIHDSNNKLVEISEFMDIIRSEIITDIPARKKRKMNNL